MKSSCSYERNAFYEIEKKSDQWKLLTMINAMFQSKYWTVFFQLQISKGMEISKIQRLWKNYLQLTRLMHILLLLLPPPQIQLHHQL